MSSRRFFVFIFLTIMSFSYGQSKGNWELFLVSDFAYYPKSDNVKGGDHFSPITGPFSALQNMETFHSIYRIKTPLGNNALLRNGNIALDMAIEMTLISLVPRFSIEYTPLPFLSLSSGGGIGYGWNLGSFECVQIYDKNKGYEKKDSFHNLYSDFWIQGKFMFDTAFVLHNDYAHIVLLSTFKSIYYNLSKTSSKDIWVWQTTPLYTNSWNYEGSVLTAYQLHPKYNSHLFGLLFFYKGIWDSSSFGEYDNNYDGSFINLELSPIMQFNLSSKDKLTIILNYASRRSYKEEYDDKELNLTKEGREWYFNRIAISWNHKFKI